MGGWNLPGNRVCPTSLLPNLPPLLPHPGTCSGPSAPPPGPSCAPTPAASFSGSPCHHLWTIPLCRSPCHPSFSFLLPCSALSASLLSLHLSLCPFSCSLSSSFPSPCHAFLITPLILAFHPLAGFSLSLSLSTSDRPPFPLFLLAPHSPLFPFSFSSWGGFCCRPPICAPTLPPQDVSWRWGVTHSVSVGSRGRRPDGSGPVGRRGRRGAERGRRPASGLEVGTVWGPWRRGALESLGTRQGEGPAG